MAETGKQEPLRRKKSFPKQTYKEGVGKFLHKVKAKQDSIKSLSRFLWVYKRQGTTLMLLVELELMNILDTYIREHGLITGLAKGVEL